MEYMAPSVLVVSPDSGFCDKVGAAAELAGVQLAARVVGCSQLPALLDALQPDILVFDADPPGAEPGRVLASLRRSHPGTAILMVASALTDKRVEDALLQGVSGFVAKSCDSREYADAMRAIRRGEIWLGREKLAHALTSLIDAINLPGHAREPIAIVEKLSPREEEIVQLISRGCTNKEIARALGMSDKTVKAHLSHIFAKLGVTRRAQLTQPRIPSGAPMVN
ncbi:response regulator transcription factor [Aromatoleum toluclasticum]|uniref:response regulator transcription factor n=1 Tax=Aromatoleum toluclasticum TaxID=92003 RepID=UPI001D189F1D|nr:response regulator transcription factor [Aromatoleum toluclasticum]MCC4118010.1 response regulator transcription factor [Aromatoleum toluclasticum]